MAIDRLEDIEAWKMGRELTRQNYADEFGALYDQARQTKAATGGFIKYLVTSNPKTKDSDPRGQSYILIMSVAVMEVCCAA